MITFKDGVWAGDQWQSRNVYSVFARGGAMSAEAKAALHGGAMIDVPAQVRASYAQTAPAVQASVDGKQTLFPFQEAGIAYARARQHSMIGDEPGLGKTAQAIVWADRERFRRVLVICPAGLRLHWCDQFQSWSEQADHQAIMSGKTKVQQTRWLVISYDLAPRLMAEIGIEQFDAVILDEAHRLKNPDTDRGRALLSAKKGVLRRAPRVLALTGTPLINRPNEIHPLLSAFCPRAIAHMTPTAFRNYYNEFDRAAWAWRPRNLGELAARLRAWYMVRRRKEDVLTQLPVKTYDIVRLEPDKGVRGVLRKERMLDVPVEDLLRPRLKEGESIATIRREMGEAKAPACAAYAEQILESEHKVVVMFTHRAVGKILLDALAKYNPVLVQGGVSDRARARAVSAFQTTSEVRVFLGQIKSAGEGLTLTAANSIILAEPDWTPSGNDQAIDRIHRIGQDRPVVAHLLVAPGSWDEAVLRADIEKRQIIEQVVNRSAE